MDSEQLICTMHEEILGICREQLEELPPDAELTAEYCGVCRAFEEIIALTEKARKAGERMENRLFQYSTAVKSLGFERVRG